MPPLIIEEEMDTMSSGDDTNDEPMSAEMLEYIRDGSQYHMIVNRRKACYKVSDCIKQS